VELIMRIEASDGPVTARIRDQLSAEALSRLHTAGKNNERAARRALFNELNPLLKSETLYTADAWADVALREEARQLAALERRSSRLMRFNRLLLEDAFPTLLKRKRFYFDETRIGYVFAFCGLVTAFIQGGMIGRLVKRFGEPKLIVASLIGVGVSLALMPYAGTLAWLLLVLALISAGSGINRAPTLGLLSIVTPSAEQGATLGVAQSAGTLGRIFGPLFATSVYAVYPHAPYLGAAGICIVAALLALKLLKRPDAEAE
jgi:hypothetical protein